MRNPWNDILLEDYENHMQLASVKQLQAMNVMMKRQIEKYPVETLMILGIAGRNGLEHLNQDKVEKYMGLISMHLIYKK